MSWISSKQATWITLMILLVGHLWSNYLAVRAVTFTTLNRQRLKYLLDCFHDDNHGSLPTPKEVRKKEVIFYDPRVVSGLFSPFRNLTKRSTFCTTPSEARQALRSAEKSQSLAILEEVFSDDQFVVVPETQNGTCIILKSGARTVDKIKAWVIACEIAGKRINPAAIQSAKDCWEKFKPEAEVRGWNFEEDTISFGAECFLAVHDQRVKKTE